MEISFYNVANYLDNFIVRFYLDSSVFEELYKALKGPSVEFYRELFIKLKDIIIHEKSEIYIYFCKKIIDNNTIEKVRSFRFISLFEENTNISIIREADGIVSFADCHNIQLFSLETTEKIMMINNYHNLPIRDKFDNYSKWLEEYQIYLESIKETNFIENSPMINILAGIFGIKVKLKESYRNEIIEKVNNFYDTKPSISNEKFMKVGYDEIILYELFSPITRIDNYNKIELSNINKQLFILVTEYPSKSIIQDIEIEIKIELLESTSTSEKSRPRDYKNYYRLIINKYFDISEENLKNKEKEEEIIKFSKKLNSIFDYNKIKKENNKFNSRRSDLFFDYCLKNFTLKPEYKEMYFNSDLINCDFFLPFPIMDFYLEITKNL